MKNMSSMICLAKVFQNLKPIPRSHLCHPYPPTNLICHFLGGLSWTCWHLCWHLERTRWWTYTCEDVMNHIETLWESKISGCKSTGCFIAMFRLPCPNISLHGSPNQSLWSVNVCGGRSLPKPVGFRMVCDLTWTVESYFKGLTCKGNALEASTNVLGTLMCQRVNNKKQDSYIPKYILLFKKEMLSWNSHPTLSNFSLDFNFGKNAKKINHQTQKSHDVSLRSNQIYQHLPLSFPPLATWKVKPGQSSPVQKIQVLESAQVVKYRRFLDV